MTGHGKSIQCVPLLLLICLWLAACHSPVAADDWPQLLGNALRSGNAPRASLPTQLGLVAAFPLTDAVLASPVIRDGRAYVIDGAGVVSAIDTRSWKIAWTFATRGGAGNCNNVAAPAVIGRYVHVGTMAGYYYVLDCDRGDVIKEFDCGEPVFAAPVVGEDRVYFATLGAKVFAVQPNGETIWSWDFVKEVIGFHGDRWKGADWLDFRGDRVTWRDHFVCSREICLLGDTVVMPAGGRTLFLEDLGNRPQLQHIGEIPDYLGNEFPATFGQSADEDGNVYVQWHRRDNAGRVEIMRLADHALQTDFVPGTETSIDRDGLLSFASVSIRDGDVYRVRPEAGRGLCRHRAGREAEVLCAAASICPPVLTREHAVYGGLDGHVHIVPLDGREPFSLATAFDAPITAAVAIAEDHLYVPCEDGYLYVYGPHGNAPPPTQDLGVWKVRSPLTGRWALARYDWYTNYGDFSGTNANVQGLQPPLRMRWARRLEGTVKHLPVCGGGRMYMHTAEGQILAVEQDTGRLLWRRYWPDVYLSFTSPLYFEGKLLVPQAGLKRSRIRCLDAATGQLLWEVPFTGSPSWSRQFPPLVHKNVVIYASGSGEYAPQGTEPSFIFRGEPIPRDGREVMSWIYSNDNPYYPRDQRPRLWAWDLETGRLLWEKDFSAYGRGGNDCGICLHDGKLFYSVFFGYDAGQRQRRGLPVAYNGLTACLEPATGHVIWQSTDYYVTSKCTLQRPRWTALPWWLQSGPRRDGRSIRLVPEYQRRLPEVEVRSRHLCAKCRHGWPNLYLFERPAGER